MPYENLQVSDGKNIYDAAEANEYEFSFTISVSSIEEANSYLPFQIKQPSVLPEGAVLESIAVHPPGGRYAIIGAVLNYSLPNTGSSTQPDNQEYTLSISQWGLEGGDMSFEFEKNYNAAPSVVSILNDNADWFFTERIMIGDMKAVLGGNYVPLLLKEDHDQNIHEDHCIMQLHLQWFKDGIWYNMFIGAPTNMFSLDDLLAIVESM